MKKLLFLLAMLPMLAFMACSDDDGVEGLSKEMVVGVWDVVWAQDEDESMDVPAGYILIDLKSSGSYQVSFLGDKYIGSWELDGNTVIGTTLDPITEYFRFVELDGKNATIDYSNSEGMKYKFKAVKR